MYTPVTLPVTNEYGYFEIRLESIGGLGANLCGKMLGELGALYLSLNSLSFYSYGAEKRGSPVKSYIRWSPCICQDWDKKNFIFFCTYSIKSLLIFKVQNSLLLLTFSLLPIEEASSFFTTGFLYYSFCLLHCISDKVLTLKHNLYVFVVVNEHLINYVRKYISVILLQHTILG